MIKLIAVSISMTFFMKWYRFGNLKWKNVGASLFASPVALILWVLPLMYIKGQSDGENSYSAAYFVLRTINSTFLVAIFEELLIRVYLMEWFYQAGIQVKEKGWLNSVLDTFDRKPTELPIVPLSKFSLLLVTALFTVGHTTSEWVSSVLYFSFTNFLYKKTGSMWVCIFIHGITNLSIALLVKFGGMSYLW